MPSAKITSDIRQAEEGDIDALYALYDKIGHKDEGYFEDCFEKDCVIIIASLPQSVIPAVSEARTNSGDPFASCEADGYIDVGFGILNFEPKYRLYQKLDIPEIQDLNVIPQAREQGVATALLNAFENLARDQGKQEIGISVGLTKDYGAAQRLYVKQGYIPDGYGVTHDRQVVEKGQRYALDDDLALMMVKEL